MLYLPRNLYHSVSWILALYYYGQCWPGWGRCENISIWWSNWLPFLYQNNSLQYATYLTSVSPAALRPVLAPQCKSQALASTGTQTGKQPSKPPSRSTRLKTLLLGSWTKRPELFHEKYGECLELCPEQICLWKFPNASLPVLCMHASICNARHGPYPHI